MTTLPSAPGYGVVLDMWAEDIDGDGFTDLVLNCTGDNNGPGFYSRQYLQIQRNSDRTHRAFVDETAKPIKSPIPYQSNWVPWIRLQDFDADGDLDILPDDTKATNRSHAVWLNNGHGIFVGDSSD
jgi:hypothetical protein